MVGALVWKEYREQRTAWVGITGLGGLLLVALARWLQFNHPAGTGSPAGYLMTGGLLQSWCYGIISGAIVLAGEREEGTLVYLDGLPAPRGWLWRSKLVAGLGLVAVQAVVVAVLLAALGTFASAAQAAGGLAGLLAAGTFGLCWGIASSARTQTIMGAIARTIAMQALAVAVLGLALGYARVLLGGESGLWPPVALALLGCGVVGLPVAALARSARAFGELDRQRRVPTVPEGRVPGAAALLWLTGRQARRCAVMVGLAGLVGGVAVPFFPLLAWPVLTLLLGVVCGVRAFVGDEEARVLLAEQRLPAGRFWLARVLAYGLAATFACVLALDLIALAAVPSLLGLDPPPGGHPLLSRLFGMRILAELTTAQAFLSVWVLHGFAAGLLGGLLFRRTLSACVAAALAGAASVAVLIPSFLGGGIHLWQVLGVPVAFLVGSRLLLPAWAAGRLRFRSVAAALAVSLTLAVTWTAAALWYRVAEIPEVPDTLAIADFLAGLPDPATDETGRRTRAALATLDRRDALVEPPAPRPLFANPDEPRPDPREWFQEQLGQVLRHGWSGDETELGRWMELMFDSPWAAELTATADRPPGVVLDPRQLRANVLDPSVLPVRRGHLAASLLAVRGLRGQARGDDADLGRGLHTGLALVRNLKNHSSDFSWFVAYDAEAELLAGLDRWLERLGDRPGPLADILDELRRHEAASPPDPRDAARADFVVVENTLRDPAILAGELNVHPAFRRQVDVVILVLRVPWEWQRQQRILHWLAEREPEARARAPALSPRVGLLRFRGSGHLWDLDRYSQVARRAALLKVALRLYRAREGRPARSLEDLLPRYLAALPQDPFDPDGRPFRYRLSRGEVIRLYPQRFVNRSPAEVRLTAGQGVVWSVGPDGRDDGGWKDRLTAAPGEDILFPVPAPGVEWSRDRETPR
jgi:hypothetical protein